MSNHVYSPMFTNPRVALSRRPQLVRGGSGIGGAKQATGQCVVTQAAGTTHGHAHLLRLLHHPTSPPSRYPPSILGSRIQIRFTCHDVSPLALPHPSSLLRFRGWIFRLLLTACPPRCPSLSPSNEARVSQVCARPWFRFASQNS